jgi:sn-glycerol 3-phosphate transport system ATP-binding protein
MAMVFQNYALYPHMSVFDNMAYALKMRRFSAIDINQRVNDVARLLQLTPYLARKPNELSGGQKQRVAMGRAMVRSPAIFLFDEPLSNLDAKLRGEMRYEIKKLHQQFNTTSLYVTHDQTEAMTLAERILVLNQGIVEQIGTPQDLYQKPATLFVAGFTGHYPINFISGIFNKQMGVIESDLGINYPVPQWSGTVADNAELILAIRPEHVSYCVEKNDRSSELKIEFIDDMGADKLIQARSLSTNIQLSLRIPADKLFPVETLHVELPPSKLHVFDKKTGKRIGEYSGKH